LIGDDIQRLLGIRSKTPRKCVTSSSNRINIFF